MITLLVIGILVLAVKLVFLSLRLAWGITKGIFAVLGIPLVIIGLFLSGLTYLALGVMAVALLGTFLFQRR